MHRKASLLHPRLSDGLEDNATEEEVTRHTLAWIATNAAGPQDRRDPLSGKLPDQVIETHDSKEGNVQVEELQTNLPPQIEVLQTKPQQKKGPRVRYSPILSCILL